MERPPDWFLRMVQSIENGNLNEELNRISEEPDSVKRMIYYLAFAKFVGVLWGDMKDQEGYKERREAALEALSRAEKIAEEVGGYWKIRNDLHQADIRIDLNADPDRYFKRIEYEAEEMDDDQLLKASVVFARAYNFKLSKLMADKIKDEKKREAALNHLKLRMMFG